MILKHRDREVLRFDWAEPFGVKNVELDPAAERFLPLAFREKVRQGADARAIAWAVEDWLMARRAPVRRRNIERMLALLGLDARNPRVIIEYSRGLSLNDVHWVDFDDSKIRWSDCNLYANDFSTVLAEMAFTGQGRHQVRPDERSPEFTTNGALPKCWRRVNGKILLYKGGSDKSMWEIERQDGFGVEPFSEFYAAQVAAAMHLDHVPYALDVYQGELCSTCPLFTSERQGFIAARDLPNRDQALTDPAFAGQFLFDAVIFNTDRHWGNFGYLVDHETNEITGPAPIFDNGYGVFSQARYRPGEPQDEFVDLRQFVSRKSPVLYQDWLSFPGGVTDEMINRLTEMRGFRLAHHPQYRLPEHRMDVIQYFLEERISNIIRYREKADDSLKIATSCDTINKEERRVSSPVDLRSQIKAAVGLFPTITREQLAERLNVGPATIARHLKALQAAGELKRIGSRKTGYWQVV